MGGSAVLFGAAMVTKAVAAPIKVKEIAAQAKEEKRVLNEQIMEVQRQARIRAEDRAADLRVAMGDIFSRAGAAEVSGMTVKAALSSRATGAGIERVRDEMATGRTLDGLRTSLAGVDARARRAKAGAVLDITGGLIGDAGGLAQGVKAKKGTEESDQKIAALQSELDDLKRNR